MSHVSAIQRFNHFSRQAGNGRDPLSDEQIMSLAPSVFAVDKHVSRSERFAYIPTLEVLASLRAEGFFPVRAVQGKSRIEGKAEFTKHMLRFRHPDYAANARVVGGVFPEVALLNAHDGTSSYRLMAGMFRLICLNGCVVMEEGGTDLRISHKGDVRQQVIEGSYKVISESFRRLDDVASWQGTELNRDEQMFLAEAAHVVRFGDAEGNVETPIRPEQLLQTRRREDSALDLWTTHNVLQENVVRGGLSAWGRNATGQRRQTTTRQVNNIDGDVKLNRALWLLSQRMAELKGATTARAA